MFGVTKILKKVFAPDYNFKHLIKLPKNKGGLKKKKARLKGKRIDYELTSFVKTLNGQIQEDCKFCEETDTIIKKCNEKNIQLLKSQVYTLSLHHKLCTFIDLVGINTITQKIQLIEVKYGSHYRKCCTLNGFLKFQATPISNCLLHQHQIQILLSQFLYNLQHHVTTDCHLVYVNGTEIDWIVHNQFDAKLLPEALQCIQNLNHKKKKKNNHSKWFLELRHTRLSKSYIYCEYYSYLS